MTFTRQWPAVSKRGNKEYPRPVIMHGLSRRRFKRIWFMVVQTYCLDKQHTNAFKLGAGVETLHYIINGFWRNNYAKTADKFKTSYFTVTELRHVFEIAEELGMMKVTRQDNKCTSRIPEYLRCSIATYFGRRLQQPVYYCAVRGSVDDR